MLNNRHKNSICNFAEPLMAYLYGEISNAERFEFEAHLKNCSACAHELAEFGFVRSTVREWRIEEFEGLPTPAFEIPPHTLKTRLVSESSRPWFYNLNRIFSFRPALAAAALAVLIAFAGIAFLMFDSAEKDQIVRQTSNVNAIKTDVSPTVEKVKEQPIRIADQDSAKNEPAPPLIIKPKDLPVKIADRKPSAANNTSTKVLVNTPKTNKESNNKKSLAVEKQNLPRLTEAEDAEDDLIRLADLFDEIDAK